MLFRLPFESMVYLWPKPDESDGEEETYKYWEGFQKPKDKGDNNEQK